MASKLLDLQNVSYSYPGGMTVLQDINLQVEKSDLIVVKGESGAGKSTILKLLNRFCDYTEGKILFNNRELKDFRIEYLRSSIIYLPQIPVMIEGTIEDNLSFPFNFTSHNSKEYMRVDALKWLDFFRLDLALHADALKLSIGQKQRIALIRSMILMPQVLLLDEPVASLDKKNRQIIEQKIESLTRTSGVTVIMVTHGDVSSSFSDCRLFQVMDRSLIEVRH
jgi:putative ABC transport system ATP-binding protein